MDDKCIDNKRPSLDGSFVEIQFTSVPKADLDLSKLANAINELTEVILLDSDIAVETDANGFVIRVIIRVSDEEVANHVSVAVEQLKKGSGCQYDVLCYARLATVVEEHLDLSGSPSGHCTILGGIIGLLVAILFTGQER